MKKYLLMTCAILMAVPAYAGTDELLNKVKSNDVSAVANLLKGGENVNGTNALGNTALHYAVAADDMDMVKLLLANGADMNAANAKGWTPLEIAKSKNLGEVYGAMKEKEAARAAAAAAKAQAVKEAQARIAAEKAALTQKAEPVKATAKKAKAAAKTPAIAENQKTRSVKKQASAVNKKKSVLSDKIYQGDEEVVYCLQYLGMQGEQKNMTVAAGFYAMETGVDKERHDAAMEAAKTYYENASADDIKARADLCGQYITPKQAAKQNQIIRSINKSIGI